MLAAIGTFGFVVCAAGVLYCWSIWATMPPRPPNCTMCADKGIWYDEDCRAFRCPYCTERTMNIKFLGPNWKTSAAGLLMHPKATEISGILTCAAAIARVWVGMLQKDAPAIPAPAKETA